MEKLNKKNPEGYMDLTAYEAIRTADEEDSRYIVNDVSYAEKKKFFKLLDSIKTIIYLAGFEVEGHIVLKDKKTGKIWK